MKTLFCATAALILAAGPALAQDEAATAAEAEAAIQAEAAAAAAPAPARAPEAAPAATPAPAADPNVYQVLRVGDRDMSCEALIAEANALNAKIAADQQAAAKKAQGGRFGRQVAGGTAAGAMRVGGRMALGRVIGGMTPFGGLVAVAATDALAASAGQAIAEGGEAEAPATAPPEQQRMNHLLGLYREKSC